MKPVKLTFYNTRRTPVMETIQMELTPEAILRLRGMIGCNLQLQERNISGLLMKVVEIVETYPV